MDPASESAASPASGFDVRRVLAACRGLPQTLAPLLPGPAQLGVTVLAAATAAAAAIAWYGNTLDSAGRLSAIFLAVVLTGFTLMTAALPRVTYAWLERRGWTGEETVMASILGAHLPLGGFASVNAALADSHRNIAGMAWIGFIGAVLWALHEALLAYANHDPEPHDTGTA